MEFSHGSFLEKNQSWVSGVVVGFLCIHMPDTFCLIHSLPEVIFEKEFCGSGVEWDRRLCVEVQLHSTSRLWK